MPQAMKDVCKYESSTIRPLNVVMFCLVVMTVAGGSLLLSAAKPIAPVDGAIEWQEESPLRAVVQLLCLNYQAPTIYAGTVKNYIFGIGAGLAILVLSIAIVGGPRTRAEGVAGDDATLTSSVPNSSATEAGPHKVHVAPLIAAQLLVGLYLLWSFASSRWLWAPELAVGGSILLTIHFLWAFGIGNGLGSSAARLASRAVVVIAVVTAAVAIWYHYGRNPTLRSDFPVGNPAFLAACLIPGILLTAALICEKIGSAVKKRARAALAIIAAAVMVICLWAFFLADSRGAYVGLLFGALAMAFFGLRGRMRWIPVVFGVAVAALGWFYFSGLADTFSQTGRSATVRLRSYAWSYAWRMFNERPFTGHGQGAFVLVGDSHVVNDVLNDPLVFESRIAHAHNEWLEVMADLGSVGIVLIAAALLLTLRAGAAALTAWPPRSERWALVGLMGALVALIVEECFSVGLRVSGVPILFYTVIGLIWALSGYGAPGLAHYLSATRARRVITVFVGGAVGLAALVMTQQDFAAARGVYRAREAFLESDYDEAIRLASLATNRLNPQRSLTNLYRLSEAHLQAAEYLQHRAGDRKRRAHDTEPPNARLLALAEEDYRLSDERCEEGSGALKELVLRSPGYINHGRVEYWLNITRARSATARNNLEKSRALLEDAVAAIRRELLRQPFSPSVAADYMRAQRNLAGSALDLAEVVDVFARPLRHHQVTGSYVDILAELAAEPEFDRQLEALLREAANALTTPPIDDQTGEPRETWTPEKLRLLATVRFMQGDYHGAREVLELAASAYDAIAGAVPFGAASCYAELADCWFFSEPNDPPLALASATRAITLAPVSRSGRLLILSVQTRMVDYFLAANEEEKAKHLLRETGPSTATDEDVLRELAARYRKMCESLLGRREAGGLLRKPPADLVPKLQRWATRAIELNPDDPLAHYLAADLAFYVGDDDVTAKHLRDAIDKGLPPDLARQFVQTARDKRPNSSALEALWSSLAPLQPPSRPAGESPSPPERRSPTAPQDREPSRGTGR